MEKQDQLAAARQAFDDVAPVAVELYERHLSMSKTWLPHPPPVDRPGVQIEAASRAALVVNLLTEDNLPYYASGSDMYVGTSPPVAAVLSDWMHRWISEEARHSIAIRQYIVNTGFIDLEHLELARMASMQAGWSAGFSNVLEASCYAAIQELATRIAHRNTFVRLPEGPDRDLLMNVVNDENLHHLFYRDLCTAVSEASPSVFVLALEGQLRHFDMPGTAIPGFRELAREIAEAGIYDARIFVEQVARPLIDRHWRIEALRGLSDEAKRARDRLLLRLERIDRLATRRAARSEVMAGGDHQS